MPLDPAPITHAAQQALKCARAMPTVDLAFSSLDKRLDSIRHLIESAREALSSDDVETAMRLLHQACRQARRVDPRERTGEAA